MSKTKQETKERVRVSQLGTFIKIIELDHGLPNSDKELAELISEDFGVNCTEEDIRLFNEPSLSEIVEDVKSHSEVLGIHY